MIKLIKQIILCNIFKLHEYKEIVRVDWDERPLKMGIFKQCLNCGDYYKVAGEESIAGL